MRRINEAWHVLRDPVRRLAHDRELGIDHGPRVGSAPPSSPSSSFASVPLADQVDDGALRASRLGDLVVLLPAAVLAAAVGCFALGMVMLNAPLLALAVVMLLLSGVLFVVSPFLALFRDRRRRR